MEDLITSLYFKGDIFLTSDAVFGVKSSLIEDPTKIEDDAEAKKYGFKQAPFWLLERDFVLITNDEAKKLIAKEQAERKKLVEEGKL